uniref:Uncharacterized protein n=1 Tax=Oryza glumipatula TaxID=40148 RepID=A0A0D9YKB8_9ORYZ
MAAGSKKNPEPSSSSSSGDLGGKTVQELLDMDKDAVSELVSDHFHQLYSLQNHLDVVDDDDDHWSEHNEQEDRSQLQERLAFYRIIGYQLSMGGKIDELDIAKLKEKYSPEMLYKKGYFQYYEDSLEWYFDPERCMLTSLDDYQRLVLCDNDQYHSNYSTYESDLAYVKFSEELANETKWFEDYLVLIAVKDKITIGQWDKVKNIVYLQALKIALRIRVVSLMQVMAGFQEYIWSMRFDCCNYKDFDGVYFEVWKRVAKQKMEFTDVLSELYREDMFPLRIRVRAGFHSMKENVGSSSQFCYIRMILNSSNHFVNPSPSLSQFCFSVVQYDIYVACIDETVPENEARQLIKEAVIKMVHRTRAKILEVTAQNRGDNSEAKLAMDN